MKRKSLYLLIMAMVVVSMFSGCGKQVTFRDHLSDYVKTLEYNDGFTILQLSDIHWNTGSQIGNSEFGCEEYILKVIEETENHAGKIDLIEVSGDTFMLSNPLAVNKFIDFMGEIGIPYTMGWGNHDREGKYNANWLSKKFENAPFCLYTEVDNDDVHERGNNIINLIGSDGNVKWQVVNLDSGASYREGAADLSLSYDYIRKDQYDWMTAEHDAVGKDVPVICYYHIAQKDNQAAWDAIESGAEGYKSKFFKLEEFAESEYSDFTEEVFLNNNVKAAFSGHAHSVDWTFTTPTGITYGLGVKTGCELYYGTITPEYEGAGVEVTEDFILTGASLVTLNNEDGDFKLEHLYLNERDNGDFVEWVEY